MRRMVAAMLSVMCAAIVTGMAIAGSMDSLGLPSAGSGMYSLSQIYDYLNSGTAATIPGTFQEPGASPGATMRTTKQIYEDIKTKFDDCEATAADVKSGVHFFSAVPGSWGVQTGALVVPSTPTITPTPTPTMTPTWSCGTAFTDSRDNRIYNTVLIGSQCWMKQNLNAGTMLASAATEPNTSDSVIEKWCYDDSSPICNSDGGLYSCAEAMSVGSGGQGICPAGWHIPTDAEWCTLETYIVPGCACDRGGWGCEPVASHLSLYTLNGDNSTGFSALIVGRRVSDGSGYDQRGLTTGNYAYYYVAGCSGARRQFGPGMDSIYRMGPGGPVAHGFPVRCIKD